jgi:hypothetical protein
MPYPRSDRVILSAGVHCGLAAGAVMVVIGVLLVD